MKKLRIRSGRCTHLEEENLINLTPLIDVVFVVLIMFILVAPLLELDRVSLAAKTSGQMKEAALVQEQSGIVIHVLKDNTILLNAKKVAYLELLEQLRLLHVLNPRQQIQLFQDRESFFETYQKVKNAAELAGFDELDVILKPGENGFVQ